MKKPLFPVCPKGYHTGPPDFVGVGVQKAGTSWLFSMIARHPKVCIPWGLMPQETPGNYIKERHFFDHFGIMPFLKHHIDQYHCWFPRSMGTITGEWTPNYALHPWIPPLLKASAPDCKLLISLRDPVNRYVSGISHAQLYETNQLPHDAAIIAFAMGLYHQQISRLLKHFERHQILILQYERCCIEPRGELRRIFEFLGLDDVTSLWTDELLSQRVSETRRKYKISISNGLREQLVHEYIPEVKKLVKSFPEIDPTLWPNFARCALM